jgi:hypothetical protein
MTGGTRPLLFVDVDGVLNPFGSLACPEGFVEHDLFPGQEPIRLCIEHGAWLHELAGRFDLAWGTGWNVLDRRRLVEILDLPAIARGIVMTGPFLAADKVPLIAAFAAGRPVAWVDDLIGPEAEAWAAGRAAPTLLVPIDPTTGLDREHVDALLDWAARLTTTP